MCLCVNCNNRGPFSGRQRYGESIVPSLRPIMAIRRSKIRPVFDKAWPLLQDTINGHLSCLGKMDPLPLGRCPCVHEQRQTQSASIRRAIHHWRALQLDNTEFLDDGSYSFNFNNSELNVPQRRHFAFSATDGSSSDTAGPPSLTEGDNYITANGIKLLIVIKEALSSANKQQETIVTYSGWNRV